MCERGGLTIAGALGQLFERGASRGELRVELERGFVGLAGVGVLALLGENKADAPMHGGMGRGIFSGLQFKTLAERF